MRVTQQMMHQNSLRHMQQNLGRFENTSMQASSGKLLHKPSDNPQAVAKAMSLNSVMSANEQYERNIGDANLWLDENDRSIQAMVDVTQRIRELGVQGGSGTLSPEDRELIFKEVGVLNDQLREFANAEVDGRYLFGGGDGTVKPFPDADSFEAAQPNGSLKTAKIGVGLQLEIGILPQTLVGSGDDPTNIFRAVGKLAENIQAGETVNLDEIDKAMERLLTSAAENGARQNRVEATESRLLDAKLSLGTALSSIEDVDYAEILIKLKSEESVYQASLSSSAKIMQTNLMDFLR
ncbi:flagellar hook-associated protein FlgL [Planococcus maritimus]|uniref:flagellar hook-associated protein FlgL n=1 Tax=Planococcus maritimus TaxID=192421 RepID=UPI000794B2EA|nr:flagellar hook-associated protein FlgL [Planococcus maritimus]KYG57870.1 flagellar biosynthesis protein FlgL [Planococcus maritimus]OED31622.1 flagellar hook-associated protein 3 [Planococcus maritimus]